MISGVCRRFFSKTFFFEILQPLENDISSFFDFLGILTKK